MREDACRALRCHRQDGELQGQKHNLDVAKLQACVKAQNEDAVRASMKEADALGVNATPTLFINGQKIDGAVPIGEVRAALDSALKDAGQPVPSTSRRPRRPHPSRMAGLQKLRMSCVGFRLWLQLRTGEIT